MQSLAASEASLYAQTVTANAVAPSLPVLCRLMPQTAQRTSAHPSTDYQDIIYTQMKREELNVPSMQVTQSQVSALDRGMLMNWLNRMHYKCQLTTATYYRCAGIMDRIMMSVPLRSQDLPVVGAAAMLVASKVEDHRPMSSEQAIILGNGMFTREDLIAAEGEIMKILDFQVTFPTVFFFLTHYLRTFGDDSIDTVLYCRYVAEVCTTSADFFGVRPSAIACSVIIFMRLLKGLEPWPEEMAEYAEYLLDDLKEYVSQIHGLLADRNRQESEFMRRKYGSDLFHRVALYPIPQLPSYF